MQPIHRRVNDSFRVVGFDPSLRNWGVAKGTLVAGESPILTIDSLDVIQPIQSKGKQVRQNSLDLEAAEQLAKAVMTHAEGAQAIFVEVPVGSQNSRASLSCGLCIGVLGALRATGVPFYEVTPTEVKMISAGKKTATKIEMIEWAMMKHPEAPWPMKSEKGVVSVVAGTAEHMADALAAIYAGIDSKSFKQMLAFLVR